MLNDLYEKARSSLDEKDLNDRLPFIDDEDETLPIKIKD